MNQAGRNAQDGISLVQTAEGSLGETSANLTRMRELAVQAANGTLTSGDRAVLDVEFQALITEIDRVANQTTFNGVNLFDGSTTSLDIQVGLDSGETISLTLEDVTASGLSLSGDVQTASAASTALAVIDTAIDSVTSARGPSVPRRTGSRARSAASRRPPRNLSAAESRIRDVDVAAETADLTRNSILQQAAVSVLAQAQRAAPAGAEPPRLELPGRGGHRKCPTGPPIPWTTDRLPIGSPVPALTQRGGRGSFLMGPGGRIGNSLPWG